jgi:hypothetical protein
LHPGESLTALLAPYIHCHKLKVFTIM